MAISYVGGISGSGTGATYNLDLTALTGGSDSAAAAGDVVVVTTGYATTSNIDLSVSGYTELADLYANDDRDANMFVGYKVMGGSPDTSITVPGANNAANGGATVVQVWRGVDPNTPIDAATTTATGTGASKGNQPNITCVTSGAVAIACIFGTADASPVAFTPVATWNNGVAFTDYSLTTTGTGSTMSAWTGAQALFNISPNVSAQPTGGWGAGETSASDSWTAATIALRPAAPYAPVHQATGTAVSATTGALTVAWPTHAVGDVALLFVESQANETGLSSANGFVQVGSDVVGAVTDLQVYWCRATSTSMASPIKTADSDHQYGVILTFRGCAPTGDPFTTSASSVKDAASTTTLAPSVTTNQENQLIVTAITKTLDATAAFASAQTNANLRGIYEKFDAGTTSGNGGGISVALGLKQTAGSTGTTDITVSSTASAMMTIALRGIGSSPTVVLNSPADASSDSDTTPTLDFTGTDTDVKLVDNYDEFNRDSTTIIDGDFAFRSAVGQSFSPSISGILNKVKWSLIKTTSPTGNAVAKIYAHSGVFGTSSVPTGAALATSDNFDVSTLTAAYTLREFTFSGANKIQLNSGTNYVVTIEVPDFASGSVSVGRDASSPTHQGNWSDLQGATWAASAVHDNVFYVYIDGDSIEYNVQVDTANTFDSQTVATNATIEAWGAGGGGGGGSISNNGADGGGGGGYSKKSISVSPGGSYAVVVGTAGGGGAPNGSGPPGDDGTAGGDSYFIDVATLLAKGGGGGDGSAGGGPAGSGGASGSGVGDTKTSGGDGGLGGAATVTGGGGGGSGGDTTGGGVGAVGTAGVGGAGGTAGTTNGAVGGAGGNAVSGNPGTAPGGAGGGAGGVGGTGGAGTAGRLIIKIPIGIIQSATGGTYSTDGSNDIWTFNANGTWVPTFISVSLLDEFSETDAGFANPDTGGDTHPFNSGENIQFTVQAGDALDADTYYWRVRGADPTGSNSYGAWSSIRSFEVTSGGTDYTEGPDDDVTVADAASKTVTKVISDTSIATDATFKTIGLNIMDGVIATDNANRVTTFLRTFTDTVTVVDANAINVGKNITEIVTVVDAFSRVVTYERTVSETVTVSDSNAKAVGKNVADDVTVSDDSTNTIVISASFNDSVTVGDAAASSVGKNISDTSTVTDAASKDVGKSIADAVTVTDLSANTIGKNVSETLTVTDATTKTVGKNISDTVISTDANSKTIGKNISDAVTVTDNAVMSLAIILGFADGVIVSDLNAKTIGKNNSETTTVADVAAKNVGKFISDTVTTSDAISKAFSKAVADVVILSDAKSFVVGKNPSDTLVVSDTASKEFGKFVDDLVTVLDNVSTAVFENVLQTIGIILESDDPSNIISADSKDFTLESDEDELIIDSDNPSIILESDSNNVNIENEVL